MWKKKTREIERKDGIVKKAAGRNDNGTFTGETWIHKFLGGVIALSLIFIFLISSFEIGIYSDFDFYEKEYRKFGVEEQLDMEIDDIMDVTEYMMSYLRGNEEVLSIETMVEGEKQDFFNEQDRLHMEDVQGLFLGGLSLRRAALIILAAGVIALFALKGNWKKIIPYMYERVLAVFVVVIVVLGVLISQNFTKCFVIFHELFFDNDLWMFDPEYDYMIRMLPEGFFFDMVIRIAVVFIALLMGFLAVCVIGRLPCRKKRTVIRNTYKIV
ncbi:MAG: TIGR01906 family membrane protein [Bariatricus sp.]